MKKITVIVPVYNVEKYIKKCLDSLLAQEFNKFEILVINDGSPDNSQKIIDEYSAVSNKIKSIKKENGGYGSVLEYAINNIKTEYFIICDPDDWLEKDTLSKLYKLATKTKADLIYGCYKEVYDSSNDFNNKTGIMDKNIFKPENKTLYTNKSDYFSFLTPSPHGKLYKTDLAKNIKFPRNVSYTDFLLYMSYINNAKTIYYTNEIFSNYLVDRPGNTATDINPRVFIYHSTVFCSIMEQNNYKNKYLTIFRMLNYAKEILYMLSKENDLVKRDYTIYVIRMFNQLDKYKSCIFKIKNLSFKEKIYNYLLMNKFINKILIKRILR